MPDLKEFVNSVGLLLNCKLKYREMLVIKELCSKAMRYFFFSYQISNIIQKNSVPARL